MTQGKLSAAVLSIALISLGNGLALGQTYGLGPSGGAGLPNPTSAPQHVIITSPLPVTIASTVPVSPATTFPVSVASAVPVTGAFPTPIPFPSVQPVSAASAFPVTGSFPTPLAVQPVSPSTVATPAAVTTPASSATSVTLLASNAARNGWTVCNNSTQILYLAKAATATTSAFTLPFPAAGVIPTCYIESGVGVYRGIITGIWVSANGTAIVTEW